MCVVWHRKLPTDHRSVPRWRWTRAQNCKPKVNHNVTATTALLSEIRGLWDTACQYQLQQCCVKSTLQEEAVFYIQRFQSSLSRWTFHSGIANEAIATTVFVDGTPERALVLLFYSSFYFTTYFTNFIASPNTAIFDSRFWKSWRTNRLLHCYYTWFILLPRRRQF